MSAGLCSLALSGCVLGPCTPPEASIGQMTFGEVRRCSEETAQSLHGIDVSLPREAPSLIADYRTLLDVNHETRSIRHTGLDIAGMEDRTPVIAAMDGVIEQAGYTTWGGLAILLYHGTDANGHDVLTAYFHLARVAVSANRPIRRGDAMGLVGMTGTSAGSVPHLHFGVYVGSNLRRRPLIEYAFSAHVNPHLHWHDGPGKITLFRPGASYPYRLGATYPVPGGAPLAR